MRVLLQDGNDFAGQGGFPSSFCVYACVLTPAMDGCISYFLNASYTGSTSLNRGINVTGRYQLAPRDVVVSFTASCHCGNEIADQFEKPKIE